MKEIDIDETKLPVVMELIEKAASIMAEKDCDDKEIKRELEKLQADLREITGDQGIQIEDFERYWSYTDLETVARKALMPPVVKSELSDAQIKEIVLSILSYSEAEMDWWLKYLEINTGLDNLTDYIFYPDLVGLDPEADLEQIADKIIADRK